MSTPPDSPKPPPNLKVMPNVESDQLEAAIAGLMRTERHTTTMHRLLARVRVAAYREYIAEGMDPEQALELAMGHHL